MTKAFAVSFAWQHIDVNMTANSLVASPVNPSLMYASSDNEDADNPANWVNTGVFVSSDNCQTWTPVNQGLESTQVHTITFDSEGNLFATTDAGPYELEKGSSTWIAIESLPKSLRESTTDSASNRYTISESMFGVDKLAPGAKRWVSVNQGLPLNTMVMALATDGKGNIYAATSSGVFKLAAGKNVWLQMPFNQFNNRYTFWFDPRAQRLYLYNNGIYELNSEGSAWTLIDDSAGLAKYSQPYGSGTMVGIYAMALAGNGKFCMQTNWGFYVQQ